MIGGRRPTATATAPTATRVTEDTILTLLTGCASDFVDGVAAAEIAFEAECRAANGRGMPVVRREPDETDAQARGWVSGRGGGRRQSGVEGGC